jgi:hypothetical protein
MSDNKILPTDKIILRELAKRYAEIAASEANRERERRIRQTLFIHSERARD